MLVDVPLSHLDRPFSYRVPEALAGQVHLGSRVKVPFGGRRRVDGWVVGRAAELPADARDLLRVVSPIPVFGPAELELLRWVADRYAGTVVDTLRLAVPPRVAAVERTTPEAERTAPSSANPASTSDPHAPASVPGASDLHPPASVPGASDLHPPASVPGASDPHPRVLGPPVGERSRRPRMVSAVVHSPSPASPDPRAPAATDPLVELVGAGRPGAVYWRPLPGEDRGARITALVEAALERGRGAIVVTPEVAAGSAVGDAVRKAFPDAADLASDLSDRRRYRAWAELRRGRRLVPDPGPPAPAATASTLRGGPIKWAQHCGDCSQRRVHRALAAQRSGDVLAVHQHLDEGVPDRLAGFEGHELTELLAAAGELVVPEIAARAHVEILPDLSSSKSAHSTPYSNRTPSAISCSSRRSITHFSILKSGTPKPDISTPDALKRALLAVKTIAYSDSASGVYVSTEMFGKLGIADEMKDKARKIPATPVGEIVARGDAEIGFQQMSELKPVEGIDIVGPLPDELQKITVFSASIATVSKEPDAGKALIKFLASPAARPEIVKSGMDPIPAGATN